MSKVTKSKSRLGRGLSSLISVSELPVSVETDHPAPPEPGLNTASATPTANAPPRETAILTDPGEIPIDAITTNPHQPRRQMNDASIAELAASLKSTGLIQPIIVRKNGAGYQLVAGERRWRAARLAGFQTIPAIVRDVDSFTQAQMALVENIQREDLNPIDRAQSYRALLDQLGLTQAELAQRLGEERSSVANYLRLLDLTEPVRELLREGKLTLGHAKVLAGIEDNLEQQRLANLVVAQELTVRNLERLLVERGSSEAGSARKPAQSAHLQDLEQAISRQLGMRSQIRAGAKGKGRLIIHYGSLDQFDELLNRMNVRTE